jgi:hypothetical protein
MELSNLHPADALGIVRARMADLAEQESALKAALVAMGAGAHEGNEWRATVTLGTTESVPVDAVREHPEVRALISAPALDALPTVHPALAALVALGTVSRQWLTAHTVRKPSATVRTVSRRGRAAAA